MSAENDLERTKPFKMQEIMQGILVESEEPDLRLRSVSLRQFGSITTRELKEQMSEKGEVACVTLGTSKDDEVWFVPEGKKVSVARFADTNMRVVEDEVGGVSLGMVVVGGNERLKFSLESPEGARVMFAGVVLPKDRQTSLELPRVHAVTLKYTDIFGSNRFYVTYPEATPDSGGFDVDKWSEKDLYQMRLELDKRRAISYGLKIGEMLYLLRSGRNEIFCRTVRMSMGGRNVPTFEYMTSDSADEMIRAGYSWIGGVEVEKGRVAFIDTGTSMVVPTVGEGEKRKVMLERRRVGVNVVDLFTI